MTPERILQKLARRSSPGTEYIAANYTVADLTDDLIKLAMTKHTDTLEQPSPLKSVDSIATDGTHDRT